MALYLNTVAQYFFQHDVGYYCLLYAQNLLPVISSK